MDTTEKIDLDLKAIKTSFHQHEKRFNELRGELMSCARKLKFSWLSRGIRR